MKVTNILSLVEVMLATVTNYLRNFHILYNVKIGLSRGFSRPMWVAGVGGGSWRESAESEDPGN